MRGLAVSVLLLVPGVALAQTAPQPSAQGDVSVTIYNNDLALIQDTRRLTLANGVARKALKTSSSGG